MNIRLALCSLIFCCFSYISPTTYATEETTYQFFGRHMIAQYYDCDTEAINNTEKLSEVMKIATDASGAQILQSMEQKFVPSGFTMVLLLSESHASIHTYPEHGACFIDFFTCGHICSAEKFEAILRDYLKPARTFTEIKDRQ